MEPAAPNPLYYTGSEARFQLQVWEDDSVTCTIHATLPILSRFLRASGTTVAALFVDKWATGVGRRCGDKCELAGIVSNLIALTYSGIFFDTNEDDPIGMLVENYYVQNHIGLVPEPNTTHTFIIALENGYEGNGGVRLVQHQLGTATY